VKKQRTPENFSGVSSVQILYPTKRFVAKCLLIHYQRPGVDANTPF